MTEETPRQTDEELMLALSGGSTTAFDELFARYRQPLYGFFRRRLADPHRAEELTQEAFLAVYRAGARYKPQALFRTYLYAIGLKMLHSERRRLALRSIFRHEFGPQDEPSRPPGFDSGLVLRDAVRRLDAIDREVLLLREFEELSYAEIADVLRLPVNTVRSRLFRARSALRDLLTTPQRQASPTLLEGKERA